MGDARCGDGPLATTSPTAPLTERYSDALPSGGCSVLFTTLLLTEALARKGFFGSTLFPRLHVVAVLLDLLDDVLTLDFSLEAPECIFKRFTLLNDNFCQAYSPPSPVLILLHYVEAYGTRIHTKRPLPNGSSEGYRPSQDINWPNPAAAPVLTFQ